jgi:hypothetical protein
MSAYYAKLLKHYLNLRGAKRCILTDCANKVEINGIAQNIEKERITGNQTLTKLS